jgi:hypothetical protein
VDATDRVVDVEPARAGCVEQLGAAGGSDVGPTDDAGAHPSGDLAAQLVEHHGHIVPWLGGDRHAAVGGPLAIGVPSLRSVRDLRC